MHSILIYGFPLILLVFEWGLRILMEVNSWGFTGPTLAAAGLSFLVPLTRPKLLDVSIPEAFGAVAISKGDKEFTTLVWILVLVFLFVWSGSCYASIKHPSHSTMGISTHLAIGGAAYFVSLVMVFIKEKV